MANKEIPKINSIPKIEYKTHPQFMEDLNNVIATLANSPLYKGIGGDSGEDGGPGARGERGSKFLFVNVQKFNTQFGNEVITGNDVTIEFLNNKLQNFNNKNKLFAAFDVDEMVDKDIVVLTDSKMLEYSINDNLLYDTGQAFNPENNFINNINQTIQEIVEREIANNPALNNISNVFDYFTTLAKSYADDNTVLITSEVTPTSVYSPFIEGYTNNVGIKIDNHNYYGYTEERFPTDNDGTMVFGNMRLYYNLLMATITTDGDNTLTSDYAPGKNNLPSVVIMQNDYNNGLYIGYKGKTNLKSFGSLYKNSQNELVLKSDSSKKENEFSELLIHKDYLKYKKQVIFEDNLRVAKNFTLKGDIDSPLIKTGVFSESKKLTNVDIGSTTSGAITRILSEIITFTQYKGRILVTDVNGQLVKSYAIETMAVPAITDLNVYDTTKVPSNKNNFLTSNYFQTLAIRINSMADYVRNNYWRKDQWNAGVIPNLSLTGTLNVKGVVNLTDVLKTTSASIDLLAVTTNINSTTVKLSKFLNKVLVTNNVGNIIGTHAIETQPVNPSINTSTGAIVNNTMLTNENNVLTSRYYNILARLFNSNTAFIVDNYWRKNQFGTGEIPELRLKNSLVIDANSLKVGTVITVDGTNTTVSNNLVASKQFQLTPVKSKVMVTDANGVVLNQYLLHNGSASVTLTTKTNTINNQKYDDFRFNIEAASGTEANNIVKYPLIKKLNENLNAMVAWVNGLVYRKDQMDTGEIPTIKVSTSLISNGEFEAGKSTSDRNLSTSGVNTTVGTTSGKVTVRGNMNFDKYRNGILSLSNTGDLVVTYNGSTTNPKVTLANGTAGKSNGGDYSEANIQADYWNDTSVWVNGSSTKKGYYDIETNANRLLTGKHFQWIVGNFRAIANKFNNYYTKTEADAKFGKLIPINSVMAFVGPYNTIPKGWVICDGRTIRKTDGTNFTAPDMIRRHLRGINGEIYNGVFQNQSGNWPAKTPGKSGEDLLTIRKDNLPNYLYTIQTDYSGNHSHNYYDSYMPEINGYTPIAGGGTTWVGAGHRTSGVRWDNNVYLYYRKIGTEYEGSHTHNITFSLGKEDPLPNNPLAYDVYYIVKYE